MRMRICLDPKSFDSFLPIFVTATLVDVFLTAIRLDKTPPADNTGTDPAHAHNDSGSRLLKPSRAPGNADRSHRTHSDRRMISDNSASRNSERSAESEPLHVPGD